MKYICCYFLYLLINVFLFQGIQQKTEDEKIPDNSNLVQGSQTLGKPKKIPPKPPQRHSSGSSMTKVELRSQGTSSTDSTTDTAGTQTILPNYRSRSRGKNKIHYNISNKNIIFNLYCKSIYSNYTYSIFSKK